MAKKIEMTVTKLGSPDGIAVHEFVQGEIYEVGPRLSENLVEIFLKEEWATLVVESGSDEGPKGKRKAVKGAPENKSVGAAEASEG